MNIPRLRIKVPAFYRCPSHSQLIGCQPSRKQRLFPSNHLPASQSLSASSQSFLSSIRIGQLSSQSRGLNSFVSSTHLSCVVCRDIPFLILSGVSHNLSPSSYTLSSDQQCLISPILSTECDENISQVEDSHSAPSRYLLSQSTSLGTYSTSSIHRKTDSYRKWPFLRSPQNVVLRHFPYTTCGPSRSQLRNCSSHHPCLTRPFTPSRHLSHAISHQPQLCAKHHSLYEPFTPLRRFSLDGFYVTLAQSPPVQTTQGLLLELHHWLPWWAVIAMVTLTVRTLIVLPLAVHQAQVIARLSGINAEMAKVAPELNKEVSVAKRMFGWDEEQAKKVFKTQLRQIYQRAVIRDNCHPFKMVLLVAFQMPLWVCLSISLRNLTAMAYSGSSSALELKSEGLLWFPDLTAADPILIPLMLLAVNLTLTEVHALRNVGKGGLLQKVLLNGSRVIIFFVAAAATINPSSVSFYWLCSSSFGLCQGLLLMSPRVRRSLGIPKMASESATPFRDIASNLRKRLRLKT